MRKRMYFAVVLAVVVLLAVVGAAQAMIGGPTQTVKSTDPGILGKTLTVHRINRDTARLTITDVNGHKDSIVLLGGDVRLSLAMAGVMPPEGGH